MSTYSNRTGRTHHNGGHLKLYRSYNFRDKDPIIDRIRTLMRDQHARYRDIEEASGVSTSTLYQWFNGETRRPQFATVMAVMRALSYDLQITKQKRVAGAQVIELRRRAA